MAGEILADPWDKNRIDSDKKMGCPRNFFDSRGTMLHSLQVGRAIAAILVVLFHTSNSIFNLPKYFEDRPFGSIFDFGYISLDFFFVLSGFIIMQVHAKDIGQPGAIRSYLGKRFTRVYLPYWVVLLVVLPVFFLVPSFGYGFERDWDVILRSVALLSHPQNHVILAVSWTLVFEVFFYVLFGLLIINKRLGMIIIAGWTVGILAHPWIQGYPWNFVFNPWHLRTLAGMGAAIAVQRWQLPAPRTLAVMGLTIALATCMFHTFQNPLPPYIHIMGCTFGCMFLVAGLAQADRLNLLTSPSSLIKLGNATYGIYLVHFTALSLFAKIAKAIHLDAWISSHLLYCLHVIVAVGIGCLFHLLIEKKLHRWSRSLFQEVPSPVSKREPIVLHETDDKPIRKAA